MWTVSKLSQYPFDKAMLSCQNKGVFPDLAIRINTTSNVFTGGELVELKDSKSYTIASFNSTIPSGQKHVNKFITSTNSKMFRQMQAAGDDVNSLPLREVFYLVRGKRGDSMKVCLVHGSFFETVKADELIQKAFSQIIEERLHAENLEISPELQTILDTVFTEQSDFSRVRDVDNASVKIRFRIMTEAKAQGNIFNDTYYPEIADDTLNFVVPCHNEGDEAAIAHKAELIFGDMDMSVFTIKHVLNGNYRVFQVKRN